MEVEDPTTLRIDEDGHSSDVFTGETAVMLVELLAKKPRKGPWLLCRRKIQKKGLG